MGKDTIYRVEESKFHLNKKPAMEFINDVFNPQERLEKLVEAMRQEMNQKLDSITKPTVISIRKFVSTENEMESSCNITSNEDNKNAKQDNKHRSIYEC